MILHGAGSAKESHFDFARGCRADGIAALAYDARGHGRSRGDFGPGAFDDVLAMVELLRGHAGAVALRGSSMGGFQAIHAGARDPRCAPLSRSARRPTTCCCAACGPASRCASAATCPPQRRGCRRSTSTPRSASWGRKPSCCCCTRGDEQIPWTVSEELHKAAHEPKRLLVLPGGHHRSLQHDLELQAVSRRFILSAAER